VPKKGGLSVSGFSEKKKHAVWGGRARGKILCGSYVERSQNCTVNFNDVGKKKHRWAGGGFMEKGKNKVV